MELYFYILYMPAWLFQGQLYLSPFPSDFILNLKLYTWHDLYIVYINIWILLLHVSKQTLSAGK